MCREAYAPARAARPQAENSANAGVYGRPCWLAQIGRPIDATIAIHPPLAATAAMKRKAGSLFRGRISLRSSAERQCLGRYQTRSLAFRGTCPSRKNTIELLLVGAHIEANKLFFDNGANPAIEVHARSVPRGHERDHEDMNADE